VALTSSVPAPARYQCPGPPMDLHLSLKPDEPLAGIVITFLTRAGFRRPCQRTFLVLQGCAAAARLVRKVCSRAQPFRGFEVEPRPPTA
jgi:hypothetical protein